jgi:hypothetical protein
MHDDKRRFSIYLFACTQADVLSRYHFLATVTTNLCEQWIYEFCGAISELQKNIMKFALDVCPADRRPGCRWISVKFLNEGVINIC